MKETVYSFTITGVSKSDIDAILGENVQNCDIKQIKGAIGQDIWEIIASDPIASGVLIDLISSIIKALSKKIYKKLKVDVKLSNGKQVSNLTIETLEKLKQRIES